jgi:predicted NBD/HSP70 family sugar kinase
VAVLTDEHGTQLADEQLVLADMEVRTVIDASAAAAASLMDAVSGARAACGRVTLGFQLGGPVDTATGTALFYHKGPPWVPGATKEIRWPDNQPLGQMLAEATGMPSYIYNDANAYAMFQLWFGAGRETSDFAVVLISEGVGGAHVSDGQLFPGPMELGNLSVLPEKGASRRTCDCGSIGCLETNGGIHGILENVYHYTSESVDNVVVAAGLAERHETREAREAFADAGHANAKGIGVIVNFFRPRQVLLYAPAVMTEPGRAAADAFLSEVAKFTRFCLPAFHGGTGLRVLPLRPYDGAHGAALLALERRFGIRPGHLAVSAGESR